MFLSGAGVISWSSLDAWCSNRRRHPPDHLEITCQIVGALRGHGMMSSLKLDVQTPYCLGVKKNLLRLQKSPAYLSPFKFKVKR
jgi:hypothetical protein